MSCITPVAARSIGIPALGYANVVSVAAAHNRLTIARQDGTEVSYDPRRLSGITAYRETPRAFAEGDRLQFTSNVRELGIANRQLGTIEHASPHEVRVRLDGEQSRTVSFPPDKMRHFDHGYAVTSHSSQGLTADRVLINVEVSAHRDLINQRFAYVAVSRAAHDAQLYTDDSTRLAKDLSRDVSKSAAIEPPSTKEKSMGFQNQYAEKNQTESINEQKIPATMYAASLPSEVISADVRLAERQRAEGLSRQEAVHNLSTDHLRRVDGETSLVPLAERYAHEVTQAVGRYPERTTEQQISSLQPTADERRHWEPALSRLGARQSDSFVWRSEHGDIQSYQQISDGKGWLHLDAHGQCYDRSARPIAAEEALSPLSVSITNNPGQDVSHAKDTLNTQGAGLSL